MSQRLGPTPKVAWLLLALVIMACEDSTRVAEYDWRIPYGYPPPFVPHENPMTAGKFELGRYLFYDLGLSGNGTISCASCHQQQFAFAERKTTAVGSLGDAHRRNSQALVNVGYNLTLTWAHPYMSRIERQLLIPMFSEDPVEMGITGREREVLARLGRSPYPELFTAAFGSPEPEFDKVTYALASFVRGLTSFDSPFDRYSQGGDDLALTQSELRGLDLFFSERFNCHHCHNGINFSEARVGHDGERVDKFHNTGLYSIGESHAYPASDTGVHDVTRRRSDMGAFRPPTLRNIEVTAPYMHDGSIETLGEVIDFYAAGGRVITSGEFAGDGRESRYKSQFVAAFEISEQEKADLIAFLHALTDANFLANPAYANPWLGPIARNHPQQSESR
jgi:cytochrome c peroxidase